MESSFLFEIRAALFDINKHVCRGANALEVIAGALNRPTIVLPRSQKAEQAKAALIQFITDTDGRILHPPTSVLAPHIGDPRLKVPAGLVLIGVGTGTLYHTRFPTGKNLTGLEPVEYVKVSAGENTGEVQTPYAIRESLIITGTVYGDTLGNEFADSPVETGADAPAETKNEWVNSRFVSSSVNFQHFNPSQGRK